MNVQVIITEHFRRDAKKLLKKYKSLRSELEELVTKLERSPSGGVKITRNTYKIRLAVKSKGRGKSGGMRIITYVYEVNEEIEEASAFTTVVDSSLTSPWESRCKIRTEVCGNDASCARMWNW